MKLSNIFPFLSKPNKPECLSPGATASLYMSFYSVLEKHPPQAKAFLQQALDLCKTDDEVDILETLLYDFVSKTPEVWLDDSFGGDVAKLGTYIDNEVDRSKQTQRSNMRKETAYKILAVSFITTVVSLVAAAANSAPTPGYETRYEMQYTPPVSVYNQVQQPYDTAPPVYAPVQQYPTIAR